jgi:HSP20 family protein
MIKKSLLKYALLTPLLLGASSSADAGLLFKSDPFFNSFFSGAPSSSTSCIQDLRFIRKKEGTYILEIALPGFAKKDVNVELVGGDTLKISGKKEAVKAADEEVLYGAVSTEASFSESFGLGQKMDAASLKASMDNGILRIEMKEDPKQKNTTRVTIS